MALPEPAPPPANADDQEHAAVVCVPCPKCGEVIRSFTVQQKARRDTATITAKCPNCKWADEADEAVELLSMTSLAPPLPVPTAFAPRRVDTAFDADAPIFPSAPGAAHIGDNGELLVDPDAEIPADEFDRAAIVDLDTRCMSPPGDAMPSASASSHVYPRSSRGGATKRLMRSRREAWLLTIACLVALAQGTLELAFLSYRLSTWKIVLVAAVLMPIVAVFLVNGLRGVWRTTQT